MIMTMTEENQEELRERDRSGNSHELMINERLSHLENETQMLQKTMLEATQGLMNLETTQNLNQTGDTSSLNKGIAGTMSSFHNTSEILQMNKRYQALAKQQAELKIENEQQRSHCMALESQAEQAQNELIMVQ